MFKNFFKLGRESNEPISTFDDVDIPQRSLIVFPAEFDDHSNSFSPPMTYTQDVIMNILQHIDRSYFSYSSPTASLKLEFRAIFQASFHQDLIHRRILELSEQRFFVGKEISRLIQSNQNDYMEEVSRLTHIQFSLQSACNLSLQSRSHLQSSLQSIRDGGLRILLSFRKMERLRSSLRQLSLVRTLQSADYWIRDRLNSGHYKEAAHCCMIFLRALNSFHNYSCCIDLTSKLLDIQQTITLNLDSKLFDVCQLFDPEKYKNLLASYTSLGKSEAVLDKIALNYVNRTRNVSRNIFLNQFGNVLNEETSSDVNLIISHISNPSMQKSLPHLIFTVMSLCGSFCEIFFSYSDFSLFHNNLSEQLLTECLIPRSLLDRKLSHGKYLIWTEAETLLNSIFTVCNYEFFPYEKFLRIIEVANVFLDVGNSFCKSSSESLASTLKLLSLKYFQHYHDSRIDDLKLFLESESWELCPLPTNFYLDQFAEFSFLHQSFSSFSEGFSEHTIVRLKTYDLFDPQRRDSLLEFFRNSEDDTILQNEQLLIKPSFESNVADSCFLIPQTNVLTANATLITLKIIGRYIQFMIYLPILASELFKFITLLYKYYFYVTNLYFADIGSFRSEKSLEIPGIVPHEDFYAADLTIALSVIKSELILNHQEMLPNCSLLNHLMSEGSLLFGIRQRMIGVESFMFLSEQLRKLRTTIENVFLQNNMQSYLDFVSKFYSNFVDISFGLRRPVYCGIARFALCYEQIFQRMILTKWDMKELLSEHNPYLDTILNEFEGLINKFDQISLTVPIPSIVRTIMFEECSSLINNLLVEGFAHGKKCTHQGRALMLFDFREFVAEIEKICQVKVPKKSYVEDYINAFYLDDEELDKWTQKHREYSPFQLSALSHSKASFKKRTTHKLLNLIEKGTPPH